MISVQQAAVELLARRKARTSLHAYIRYTNRNYKVSRFSETVCAALDKFVVDVQAGLRPILILRAPPQHGKLCADETPVLTASGWKTHGELRVGDELFGPDGLSCKVVAVSDKYAANCRVELTDGSIFYCHENHEWLVRSRDLKREVVISTLDMNHIVSGQEGKRGSRFNYQLPSIQPLLGRMRDLPVSPYTLGAWLGDGTRTAPNISGDWKDVAIIQGIIDDGYPLRSLWVHRDTGVLTYSFATLWDRLKLANVTSTATHWIDKSIPDIYYTASLKQRLDLLAGLLDTDGYVYHKNGRAVFTSSEFTLAQSVAKLIATFGWRATIVKEKPRTSSSGIIGRKDYWVVGFNPTFDIPCRIHRKRPVTFAKKRRIAIRSVTIGNWGKVGHCIQVDREDGLYLIGHALIPTHNSEIVSRKLPAYLLGRFPEWRIGTASYSSELAHAMGQDVRRNLASQEHKVLFPQASEKSKFDLNRIGEFNAPGGTGSYLGVGIGSGLTGRPVDVGIIDDPTKDQQEALSPVTKETHWNWYQSVFTTRLSERSGQIVMATSWAEDDLLGRIAEQFRGDGRLTHLRFPAINSTDETGYNAELPEGALVPELHSLEKLVETKALFSDYWWSSIYQQVPKALGGNVFKDFCLQYWEMSGPRALPKKFDKVIASWDCTFKDTDGTDFVVGQVWGKTGANSYLLDQVRARMSFSTTVKAVATLKTKWPQIREILIEDKANGPAVIDVLKAQVPGILPIEPDGSKLARAHAVTSYWEALNIWLPHEAVHPWVRPLVSELTSFPAGAHDDQVDAMTQALRRLYPLHGRLNIKQAAINRALGVI